MQMVVKNLAWEVETMEETTTATVFKRFGDEQSTLLDKYERLSFEVQLNQAMLGRSLSEPAVARRQAPQQIKLAAARTTTTEKLQGPRRSRVSGFRKVMKKLFSRPILGKKMDASGKDDQKDHMFWKTFSRSLRI